MKTMLLVVAATVLAAPLAYADDVTAMIQGIDTSQHRIGLDNGKVYAVVPEVLLNNLKPGDKVTVSFSAPTAGMSAQGIAGLATQVSMAK
jgi:Protein of unknown function (DUF1344)